MIYRVWGSIRDGVWKVSQVDNGGLPCSLHSGSASSSTALVMSDVVLGHETDCVGQCV